MSTITLPQHADKFVTLWSKLKATPEVSEYSLHGVRLEDALKLGRMSYALTGTPLRGMRLAGSYQHQYIVVFGEYGHLTLELGDYPGVTFNKSQSYFFHGELGEATRRMDEVVIQALLSGLKVSSLLQWYDSVYRRVTGRHVSPNFDPVKSLDKSSAAIIPGLYVLERLSPNHVQGVGNVSHFAS